MKNLTYYIIKWFWCFIIYLLIFPNLLRGNVATVPDDTKYPEFQTLPQNFDYNSIRAIIQDYKGYIWFGTEFGLVRFDGINLYVYISDPEDSASICHNSINSIVEDKNHFLWIGTSAGLNLYNRAKDNFINVGFINPALNRFVNTFISTLSTDSNSLLWIGTYGDGLNAYDPQNQTLLNYPYVSDNIEGITSNRITALAVDHNNYVWVGTQNGLNMLSDRSINAFKHFYHDIENTKSLSDNNITVIEIDKYNNVWVGTKNGGLNRLIKENNDYSFNRYNCKALTGKLSNNSILSLNADNKGNLWIGTENEGLARLNINTQHIQLYKVKEGAPYSLNSNSIWSLYTDNEGRLWIGTYNKGVNVIDEKFNKFESYQKNSFDSNSLPDNDVQEFAEDIDGKIWIATDGGGICRFDPETKTFTKIIKNGPNNEVITNNAIQTIIIDSKNHIWAGTWGGGIDLLTLTGERLKNYKVEITQGGGNNNIFNIYEDPDGNIWVGTAGSGLFIYSPESDKFNSYNYQNSSTILNSSAYVTSILKDSEGSLWIGTLYGLVLIKNINNKKSQIDFSRNINTPGLSSNMIICIYEDNKNRIWIGTGDNGLNLFNRKDSSFLAIQAKDGLPGNTIRGILEDDKGYLWIITNKGLLKFNYDSLSFTNYTTEDGLNSNELYTRAILKTKKGEFYIGGENGFNTFFPENIKKNNVIPQVFLTNLKINNVQVKIGEKNSPLKNHISETEIITLNHKQSSFTIDFVALNYTRSAKNQFLYKLEGFDNDWNWNGTNTSVSYTNIKPGKYVFMVKGSNNDGIWNKIPAKLIIIIKPPVWKTWWAITIYIVLFCVLTLISLNIYNERIRIKNQLKLEKIAREKEHELNELNIQFFTNISHEFRTPLSLIIAPLESLITSVQNKFKEQLILIYRNAERLLQLTNNLMDIRKLEDGKIKLKVQQNDIVSFIKDVSSFFFLNSKSHNINFSIESVEPAIQGYFDPEKLETVLLNLLSNAFKYTPDNGNINISIKLLNASEVLNKSNNNIKNSRHIEIEVKNTGVGIIPEELPYIFDKFYQAKSSGIKKKSGTGIGLTLTKALIEMHHGQIRAESNPGKETRFTFIFPIESFVYSENEIELKPKEILKNKTKIEIDKDETVKADQKELAETNTMKEQPEILIAEDNDELRIFIAKELAKKYKVIQAEDGKKGIELARTEVPDLIVSDILMPECNGIELCKTIKTDIRTCHIPVVLLTAKSAINEQIEGIETGADAYITKPFNIQFLFAQINQLIQTRKKLYAQFSQDVYIMPNKITANEMDQEFIQKAIDYITLNITNNNLNVEELAIALNMSHSNVYRKIKALTGKTIIEFIRIIRLKQAIKLMESKKYTLAEIAYQTGFTSPAYFTKSFKDQYGKPPSEYLT
ncbi:MAG: response regulator [Bacteroidales bacterium]|nr:response regulator [Bacteroidales bacterium]